MKQATVCVVGACMLDLISYVPRLPRLGETLHGTRFRMGFGGKGANQAVMAAKLGGQVSMIAKLGKDVFGQDTLENFKRHRIDTSHVLFTEKDRNDCCCPGESGRHHRGRGRFCGQPGFFDGVRISVG